MQKKILTKIKAFAEIMFSPRITFGQRLNLLNFLFKTKILGKKIIRSVELIHTLKCNCRCKFCSNERLSEKNPVMSKREVKKTIDKLADHGTIAIVFLGGESLMDSNFLDYVHYARKKKIIPLLQTNGTLLTEKMIKKLAKAGLFSITISLHDTFDIIHDKTVGFPGAMGIIKRAIPLLKKYKIKIVLKTIYSRESVKSGSFERILRMSRKNNMFLNINPFMPVGKGISAKNLLSPSEKRAYKKILKNPMITAHTKTRYDSQCPAGKFYLGILPDGEILPCYFLPVSVGNIKEIEIKEAQKRAVQMSLFRKKRDYCIVAMNRDFYKKVIKKLYSGKYKLPVRYNAFPEIEKMLNRFKNK